MILKAYRVLSPALTVVAHFHCDLPFIPLHGNLATRMKRVVVASDIDTPRLVLRLVGIIQEYLQRNIMKLICNDVV